MHEHRNFFKKTLEQNIDLMFEEDPNDPIKLREMSLHKDRISVEGEKRDLWPINNHEQIRSGYRKEVSQFCRKFLRK